MLSLMERVLAGELPELRQQGVRLRVIGELGTLPRSLREGIARCAVGGQAGRPGARVRCPKVCSGACMERATGGAAKRLLRHVQSRDKRLLSKRAQRAVQTSC